MKVFKGRGEHSVRTLEEMVMERDMEIQLASIRGANDLFLQWYKKGLPELIASLESLNMIYKNTDITCITAGEVTAEDTPCAESKLIIKEIPTTVVGFRVLFIPHMNTFRKVSHGGEGG